MPDDCVRESSEATGIDVGNLRKRKMFLGPPHKASKATVEAPQEEILTENPTKRTKRVFRSHQNEFTHRIFVPYEDPADVDSEDIKQWITQKDNPRYFMQGYYQPADEEMHHKVSFARDVNKGADIQLKIAQLQHRLSSPPPKSKAMPAARAAPTEFVETDVYPVPSSAASSCLIGPVSEEETDEFPKTDVYPAASSAAGPSRLIGPVREEETEVDNISLAATLRSKRAAHSHAMPSMGPRPPPVHEPKLAHPPKPSSAAQWRHIDTSPPYRRTSEELHQSHRARGSSDDCVQARHPKAKAPKAKAPKAKPSSAYVQVLGDEEDQG